MGRIRKFFAGGITPQGFYSFFDQIVSGMPYRVYILKGGPGTGKTFTAESVAELAEKPLFRVTCGDIGTKPEDVEKYLESVLNLSKIWGCVVLLDEAEVFLEKRMITDHERIERMHC